MSTMLAFVLTLFLLIHSGIGDKSDDQCYRVNNNDENVAIDRYVPLGQHFNFTCDAYERIKQKYLQINSVQWSFRCQKDSILLDNNPNSRFIYDSKAYFLIGYDIQRIHEGVLECRVSYKNSLTNGLSVESSIINLKVQDCNEKIDSNASHALRNPCQFGECKVVSANLGGIKHEKLYCDCFEQYTGLFCDVEKAGTWWRELLYYSSTFGHFLCTGIIFLCFYCFDRSNSKERISLKEDVPDIGRIRDQRDILYPAARKQKPPPQQQQARQDQAQDVQPQDPMTAPQVPVENPVVTPGLPPVASDPQEQQQRSNSRRSQQRTPRRQNQQQQQNNVAEILNVTPQQVQAAPPPAAAAAEGQPQQNEGAVSPTADRVRDAYLTLRSS